MLPRFRTHPNLEYRQCTDILGQHIIDHGLGWPGTQPVYLLAGPAPNLDPY